MSKRQHPRPWRVVHGFLMDADSNDIDLYEVALQSRIVRAVNSFESPTAGAEMAVVSAARGALVAAEANAHMCDDCQWIALQLAKAVDRLKAARAKARKP